MSDGNIMAAKVKLKRAVDRLIEKRPAVHYDATVYQPSLYACLVSDLAGTQGDTRTPAKSLPPLWIDAVQLATDIDYQTRKWCPKPGNTPYRLQSLAFAAWRPQDTDQVFDIIRTVNHWCESILNLLDPENRKYIEDAACPSCGKKIVYRRDGGGDMVRQPALKLVVNQGCTCQSCDAFWAPEKFLFLGRLLGYDTPEGVLE